MVELSSPSTDTVHCTYDIEFVWDSVVKEIKGDDLVHKTQDKKLEEELNRMFKANIVRMDMDTTSRKGMHEKIINDFGEHKYDILVGTQMIAKGLDFPLVTLVGVINADASLSVADFRSSEFTFELLSQVAGRAGRGNKKGNVIIQTYNPDHYAILYAKENNNLWILDNIRDSIMHGVFDIDEKRKCFLFGI